MSKPRKLTPQESMVAAFFRHSVSGHSTFHPKLFGNGREPADMVVVVGRAMIFVNMHHGRSYFDDLCAHNINQARDRIEEWKSGKPIRGENGAATFNIAWSDIDAIHVVSVVDGKHSACSGHDISSVTMDPKVRLVTTLTSSVMRRLAKLGGGARDLIAVSQDIAQMRKVTESDALLIVNNRHDTFLRQALSSVDRLPNRLAPAVLNGRTLSPIEEHKYYLELVRRQSSINAIAFIDMSLEDVFCIVGHVLNTISDIEWASLGHVSAYIVETRLKFLVVVSTNLEELSKKSDFILSIARKSEARFIYTISLTELGVIPMFAVTAYKGQLVTELELAAV